MKAIYVQRGESIDYTPVADVSAGDVIVVGDQIGIAKLDIAAGVLGALATTGVFDVAKTVATEITLWANLYWDATDKIATTDSSKGKLLGLCIKAAAGDSVTDAGDGDEYVRILKIADTSAFPTAGAAIADLTDSSGGTAADEIAEITDVDTAADGVASNAAKINLILAAMRTFGIIAESA